MPVPVVRVFSSSLYEPVDYMHLELEHVESSKFTNFQEPVHTFKNEIAFFQKLRSSILNFELTTWNFARPRFNGETGRGRWRGTEGRGRGREGAGGRELSTRLSYVGCSLNLEL